MDGNASLANQPGNSLLYNYSGLRVEPYWLAILQLFVIQCLERLYNRFAPCRKPNDWNTDIERYFNKKPDEDEHKYDDENEKEFEESFLFIIVKVYVIESVNKEVKVHLDSNEHKLVYALSHHHPGFPKRKLHSHFSRINFPPQANNNVALFRQTESKILNLGQKCVPSAPEQVLERFSKEIGQMKENVSAAWRRVTKK
ncbi:unnamed protein product [Rotaria socialis]|uniref:Uncharacterized protein n=1 Tax=Rotaria socialis TaxID=392032 RepID=A0A817U5U1_9BILA|nr:unnamed protein product [Rotaria socialis]